MGSWWSFTSSIEYVASAYYCLYSSFLHPWIRSTSAEAVATSAMPMEASPCSTATDLSVKGSEGLILIIGTYLGLAILGLKFIFKGVISPKNSFIARWECHATRLTLLVTLGHKLQREDTRLRNCIPPENVLAIGLYRLAHGGSFSNAGIAMNVGKATVGEAFLMSSMHWSLMKSF